MLKQSPLPWACAEMCVFLSSAVVTWSKLHMVGRFIKIKPRFLLVKSPLNPLVFATVHVPWLDPGVTVGHPGAPRNARSAPCSSSPTNGTGAVAPVVFASAKPVPLRSCKERLANWRTATKKGEKIDVIEIMQHFLWCFDGL